MRVSLSIILNFPTTCNFQIASQSVGLSPSLRPSMRSQAAQVSPLDYHLLHYITLAPVSDTLLLQLSVTVALARASKLLNKTGSLDIKTTHDRTV